MSNIAKAFDHGKALIPFITCGDPSLEQTAEYVRAAVEAGADLVELGIPFSDPTAEGAVIMEADARALAAGTTTEKVFDLVRDLRRDTDIPMVFMTYANVLFSYGSEDFIRTSRDIGIDGFIIPDIPFEEKAEFDGFCKAYDRDLISMIAPTSEDRISMIAREASGFLYCVSSLGVTGTRGAITTDVGAMVRTAKKAQDIPCAVGFGISGPDQAAAMAAVSDGAIVGSAIMKIIAQQKPDTAGEVYRFVKELKDAVRSVQ